MPGEGSRKHSKWWRNPFKDQSTAASPAPSPPLSTLKVQSPSPEDVKHGKKASNDATGPHAPHEPSAADVQTTRARTDAGGKEPHQLTAASTIEKAAESPRSEDVQKHVPFIEPPSKGSQPATEPTQQQSPVLSTSQRLWNAAYDGLEKDNAELVGSYVRTLANVLETEASEESMWDADKIATKLKDPSKRQEYMKKLVVEGQVKVAELSKIMKAMGGFANAILVLKPTVDMLIQNIPQTAPAALPWGGFCAGLQILSTAAGEVPSNLAGITHVVSRMDWYCALTEHLLNKEKILIGNESFEAVLEQLEKAVITLYKGLLLYQMKSVCFYYRKRGVIFLRALVGLDNWDGDLKSVTDVEDVLQKYSEQYHKEYDTSALYQLVLSSKETEGLLGDIRQDIRQLISGQEKNRSDDAASACLRALDVVDPHHHMATIKENEDELLEDTYKWILDTQEYMAFTDWNNNGPGGSSNRLLWIKGDAGTGKTMLMISIIRKLSPQTVVQIPKLSFFFCQGGNSRRNDATAVLKSLIWLLLIQQRHLISHFQQKYEVLGANLLQGDTAFHALYEVFQDMLKDPRLSPVYLAVDALDECENGQSRLIELISTSIILTENVKWLVSSRPSVKLDGLQLMLLELDARSLEGPVNAYIAHKLLALKGYSKDQLAELSSEIGQRAANTFLWVALVFKELRGRGGNDAVRMVKKIPSGLSAVYNHIMIKIELENEDDQPRCKDVLAAISLAYRPLSRFELAVTSVGSDVDLTRIIEKCRSFLTIKEDTVYLIHQSARDYLKENFESRLQKGGVVQGHANICMRSIAAMSILKRDIHTLEDYGFKPKDLRPPNPDPLVSIRYSCLFWVDHLCDANSQYLDFKKELADDRKMWDFFNDHLCDENGLNLNLQKELTDNGARWKFFNEHLANHQSLNKQLADGGAVWKFFNSHLYEAGQSLDFEKELATGGAVWKFFNDHLVNSQSPDFKRMLTDGGAVWRFFNNHFLHWLESLSLLGELPASVRSIRKLFAQLQPAISPNLTIFLKDAEKFVLSHGSIIERAPLQVYGSALVFSPNMSEIRKKQWKEKLPFIKTVKGVRDHWSTHLQTLEGHSEPVTSVAFSSDGTTLASASGDTTVRLWDTATGAHKQTLEGHSDWVTSVAFSSDGTTLASASDDTTVRLWDTATGAHKQTLEGHSEPVTSVAFSSDGTTLASASGDTTVRLWDTATGAHKQTLEGHSDLVTSVAFSSDGTTLASASDDTTVRLWDTATGAHKQTLEGHSEPVTSVAFSSDGTTLASASDDTTVRLWDTATGAHKQTLEGHSDWVTSVAFSSDGTTLASASGDTTVRLWDTATGAHKQTLEGHSKSVTSVAFSSDGTTLASASGDTTVRLWDTATGAHKQTLEGHSKSVTSVAFSSDGTTLASASGDTTVRLWDTATGAHKQTLEGHSKSVTSVAFSSDGTTLASASRDTTVRLWDTATGAHKQTLEGHSDWVTSVAFSSDGTTLASASDDTTVRLWDTATGAHKQTLEGHSDLVTSVAFSSDGTTLASASDDTTVRLWDTATGAHKQTLEGHSEPVTSVAFSSDGTTLASASDDTTVRLWDTATGAHKQTLEGHSDWVTSVAFSSDGTTLASASGDTTVRLWDTATGAHKQTINVDVIIRQLSFSSDGGCLHTDRGVLDIICGIASSRPPSDTPPLFIKEQWIVCRSRTLLWLPPDYRAMSVAVLGNIIALGHASGRVSIMEFDIESKN